MLFQSKVKDENLLVRVRLVAGEELDKAELARFAKTRLRGFLRPALLTPTDLGYKGFTGIRLSERLIRPITKQDFLMILEQFVMAVRSLQVNGLPIHYLMMDLHEVYYNEATKELQFIYLPLSSTKVRTDMISFLEKFTRSVHPRTEGDMAYAQRFLYHFTNMKPFSIEGVEQFVMEEDPSVIQFFQGRPATIL